MTLKEKVKMLGKIGYWTVPGRGSLTLKVEILDAREVYGRTDLRIHPVDGFGSRWVEESAVEFAEVTA